MKHVSGNLLTVVWILNNKNFNLSLNYLSILGQNIDSCNLYIADMINNPNIKKIVKNWNKGNVQYKTANTYAELSSILKSIKTTYICFINNVDQFKFDKLKKQLYFMINNNLELSYTYCSYISYTKKKEKAIPIKKQITSDNIYDCLEVNLSSIMIKYKKNILDKEPINNECEFVYHLFKEYKVGVLIPEILTYVSHQNFLNSDKNKLKILNMYKISFLMKFKYKIKILLKDIF